MSLYKVNDNTDTVYASDTDQLVDALSGNNDIGQLKLFLQISAPGAPTVAVNTTAGNLNGAYKYAVAFVTGYWQGQVGTGSLHTQGNTGGGTASASVSPVSQQVNLTNLPIGPTGTVARIIYRTKAGGSTYYLLTQINDNTTTSYTDNVADTSLGAQMPTTNTTGTSLTVGGFTVDPAGNVTAPLLSGPLSGNASTATKLANARAISLTGDVTGSGNFDGSAALSFAATLATSGVIAGTYPKVTVDAKGRVTAGQALSATDIPGLDWSKITSGLPTTLGGYGITDALASSLKGAANGVASLDGSGYVPTSQLGNVVAAKIARGSFSDTTSSVASGATLTKTIPIGFNATRGRAILTKVGAVAIPFGVIVFFDTTIADAIAFNACNTGVTQPQFFTYSSGGGLSNPGTFGGASTSGYGINLYQAYISGSNLILVFQGTATTNTISVDCMWEVEG